MVEYTGEFSTCEVGTCPVENLGFEPNKCLGNAYKVAEQTGAMIVEGVLRIGNAQFVKHAWNKLGDLYFDPTKDYVFETDEFRRSMSEYGIDHLTYDYVKCIEYDLDECNRDKDGNILFRYAYNTILDVANGG